MRVIVNTECVKATRAGVGHHTSELVGALRRTGGDTIDSYTSVVSAAFIRHWTRQNRRCVVSRERGGARARLDAFARHTYLAVLRRVSNLVAPHLLAPNPFDHYARRRRYDLYHEPNFIPHPSDLPTVVTVHDLSVLLHPEWHPAPRVAEFERGFRAGLRQACHLLTVSEAVKGEVVRHLNWPAERVTVTYNGRRRHLRPLAPAACAPALRRLRLKPGYLLHVGTIEPRKNLALLLAAHAGLPAAVRERHPLVLVGGTGWQSDDLEAALAARPRDGTVRRLGYVADADLAAVYSSARALAFPTFYEGFGMPTIEMMACGGAVLASTAGAVAETVGGAAHLIDPRDEGGWRDAMLRACTDDDWWNALRAGAEDAARPFTWERCADATRAAYRAALGEAAAPAKRAA